MAESSSRIQKFQNVFDGWDAPFNWQFGMVHWPMTF